MYRKQEQPPIPPEKFELTFEGRLSQNNRWVMMAELIPWSKEAGEQGALSKGEN